MNRVVFTATAIVLFCALAATYSGSAEGGDEHEADFRVKRLEVMKSISSFVHGIRHRNLGLVKAYYRVRDLDLDGTAPRSSIHDKVAEFLRSCTAPDGLPIVYVAKPTIKWQTETAIVDCVVIWNVVDNKGRRSTLTPDERFVLSWASDRYVITGARSTPAVFKHIHKPCELKLRMRELANE